MSHFLRRGAAVAALSVTLLAPAVAATAAPRPAKSGGAAAEVTLVHGVRGLVADVTVDGKKVLSSFSPQRSAGPLALTPGAHRVVVTKTGESRPVLTSTMTVRSGEHVSYAIGLNDAGKPALYRYDDALASDAGSPASLVMRDVADVAGVRAVVDGHREGPLSDGQQLDHAIAAGTHTVALVDTASGKSVLPAQRIPVSAGAVTALYLIGSAQQGDLGWLATRVTPAGATPSGVHTGNSGLAAPAGVPWAPITLAGLGALGLAGAFLTRRRVRVTG
jgi:hypothetical protein